MKIAEALAVAGADVVLAARTKSEIEKSAKEISESTNRQTLAVTCDV